MEQICLSVITWLDCTVHYWGAQHPNMYMYIKSQVWVQEKQPWLRRHSNRQSVLWQALCQLLVLKGANLSLCNNMAALHYRGVQEKRVNHTTGWAQLSHLSSWVRPHCIYNVSIEMRRTNVCKKQLWSRKHSKRQCMLWQAIACTKRSRFVST